MEPIINAFEADRRQRLIAHLKPAGNLLQRPTLLQPLAKKGGKRLDGVKTAVEKS